MGARLIRQGELVRRPWKNGGGTTAEIAAGPPGADLDGFEWRVSMADVAEEGPFSIFPGIDRTLVLIEGECLDLEVEGVTHRLDAVSPVSCFTGEARSFARLPAGPIRDLNVMTRRGRRTHSVHVARMGGAAEARPRPCPILIVGLADRCVVTAGSMEHGLDRLDALILDPCAEAVRFRGAAILIRIDGP